MTEKKIKVTVVAPDELEQWDEESGESFIHYPSKYYLVDALGNYIFYHCRNRADAQRQANEEYDSKYTIRQAKQSSGSGEYSCKGTQTRRGQKKY